MLVVGRFARCAIALSIGSVIVASGARASATQTELVAGLGVIPPARSDYRTAAQSLGYALDYPRVAYEGELGARFAVACERRFWIGPIARVHLDHLGSPYGGLDAIWAESATVGVREEFLFNRFPPLFLWMDEAFGLSRVGHSGDYKTLKTFDIRGGVGMRMGLPAHAFRLRIGWSYAPTIGSVTPAAGGYDFGGFVLTIDGVLRVADE